MLAQILRTGVIRGAGTVAGLIVSVILISYLEAAELGVFFLVQSVSQIAALLGSLGLGNAVLPVVERRRSEGEKDAELAGVTALAMAITLGCSVGLLVGLVAPYLPGYMVDSSNRVPAILGCMTAAALIQMVLVQFCRTRDLFVLAAFLQAGQGRNLLLLITVPLLFFLSIDPAERLAFALDLLAICAVLPVLLGLILSGGATGLAKARKTDIRPLLRTGSAFYPSVVLTLGTPHLLLVALGAVAGPAAAAVFGFARRIAGAVAFFQGAVIITYVQSARLARRGRVLAANRNHVRSAVVSTLGTVLFSAAYLIVGIPIVELLADVEKLPLLHWATAILLVSSLLVSAFGLSTTFLRNMGEYGPITRSVLTSSVVALAIVVTLSGFLGALAGALAMVVHSLVFHGMNTAACRARFRMPRLRRGVIPLEVRTLWRAALRFRGWKRA